MFIRNPVCLGRNFNEIFINYWIDMRKFSSGEQV